MRVSVVVCTYNRAEALRVTLDALRHQTFTDFEVVVVNGPSTDHTVDVLDDWSDAVKLATNPEPNLSISRNLGIAAAAGDLVAFIDDDAIPEFDWLADVVAAFEADATGEVAGVGGLVFDHTGTDFQFRFAASSRLGEPKLSDTTPFDDLCLPGAFWFPYLQGTNAVFRRDVLVEVGGFDETFDYYLDETDLCARIVDAGYLLRQLDDAHVHHKFLPSHLRNEHRVFTRWYPVIKNLTYFGLRHAADEVGVDTVLHKAEAELAYRLGEVAMHERFGELPVGSVARVEAEGRAAIEEGRRVAAEGPRTVALPDRDRSFLPFPALGTSTGRVLVVVTATWGDRASGGIARFLSDVVPRLAVRGHELRVVTTSPDHSRVDFEDGIWIHRVDPLFGGALPGTAEHVDHFASVAATEVARIDTWRPVDLVYGPCWDLEVLPIARATDIPVVAFLATPVAVTNHLDEHRPHDPAPYARLLMSLEAELFEQADLLHADSVSVAEVVQRRYPVRLDPRRVHVAHLGSAPTPDMVAHGERAEIVVLYVGRLEPRKGVDDLLRAVELLAPTMPGLRVVLAGRENVGEGHVVAPFLERNGAAPWLDRITFTGAVDGGSLEQLAASADIAVVPSLYESFGLTVTEAMRRGTAIVATCAGAIPELVTHGVEAMLVPPRQPAALATAIRLLAEDAALRAELGARARHRFEQSFTLEHAVDRLEAALARVHRTRLPSPLAPGDAIDVAPARAARLALTTLQGATLRADRRSLTIAPTAEGRVARVDLPTGCSRFVVEDGCIDRASLIVLEPEVTS